MQKGVSPVVATVLLIAIAVISAVAAWYWVSAYTAKPPLPETSQRGYMVTGVYDNASVTGCNGVDIKNVGGISISNLVFEIKDYVSGRPAGPNGTDPTVPNQAYVNITSEITAGSTAFFNISVLGNASNKTSVPFGTYLLRPSARSPTSIAGLNDRLFTCS